MNEGGLALTPVSQAHGLIKASSRWSVVSSQ
jgi:hypothetical protein